MQYGNTLHFCGPGLWCSPQDSAHVEQHARRSRPERGRQLTPGTGADRVCGQLHTWAAAIAARQALAFVPWLMLAPHLLFAATISVTTTADDITANDGSVSLREAITAMDAGNDLGDADITAQNPGPFGGSNTINFAIAGSAIHTILVGNTGNGALPEVTTTVAIDGYSEPLTAANSLPDADNAHLLIELDGTNAGSNANGLVLAPGSAGSSIRGLVINRFAGNGVVVQTNGNTITGNFIGVNPPGDSAEPNQIDGIRVESSFNNTIGGTLAAARNIVSGNAGDGVHLLFTTTLPPAGNTIVGNFIGTDAAGVGPVGLRTSDGTPAGNALYGIEISRGTDNAVGGTAAGSRNVVGFNFDGIELDDGAQNNVVAGNFVGVGADGITPVGQDMHGIAVRSDGNLSPPFGPAVAIEPATAGNTIGGIAGGAGNLIEFNGSAGVAVFGNPLPNNEVPAQNSGNAILRNSIFMNDASDPAHLAGIDLARMFVYPNDDGVTANDSGGHGVAYDPNNFQNYPVLGYPTFSGGHTLVGGTLTQSVSPATVYRIEFFSSSPCSKTGYGEGEAFIGAITTMANAAGIATFVAALPLVASTASITATATNITADPGALGSSVNIMNTSEFSACVSDLVFRDGFE